VAPPGAVCYLPEGSASSHEAFVGSRAGPGEVIVGRPTNRVAGAPNRWAIDSWRILPLCTVRGTCARYDSGRSIGWG